jgi:hypothetical protein
MCNPHLNIDDIGPRIPFKEKAFYDVNLILGQFYIAAYNLG